MCVCVCVWFLTSSTGLSAICTEPFRTCPYPKCTATRQNALQLKACSFLIFLKLGGGGALRNHPLSTSRRLTRKQIPTNKHTRKIHQKLLATPQPPPNYEWPCREGLHLRKAFNDSKTVWFSNLRRIIKLLSSRESLRRRFAHHGFLIARRYPIDKSTKRIQKDNGQLISR